MNEPIGHLHNPRVENWEIELGDRFIRTDRTFKNFWKVVNKYKDRLRKNNIVVLKDREGVYDWVSADILLNDKGVWVRSK